MIVDERYVDFIGSFDEGLLEYLEDLRVYAKEHDVPIIRRSMESFLKTIFAMHRPKQILEVGTAIGFSALLMSEYAKDAHITTIENYDKRIVLAKENFKTFQKEDQITLLEGDAQDILKDLHGEYDFIFMDAAKGQYINFLPDVFRLLKSGGVLLSDNVLQDGEIIESRYAVTRRNRTIHSRMREYLYVLTHDENLTTTILTLGDGVALSVKK